MKVVEEARQYRGKAMLGHLNRAINLMIKPGLGNWTDALDTIKLGVGDCKGYSIAKYFALLQAGVSTDNLRLAIVYNQRRSDNHMVVAVRQDETWSILDNLTMLILSDFEQKTYLPMFVLDYTGVRRYL
jgi:predicted transglutaminase-like cysteine proteinase